MADHVDITLWVDRRWKDAIEKHLKGETLQEHLENVLDELCNQLPEQEYKRISAEIYAEDDAEREAREVARTYAAYHVTEHEQEWYFKTSPGEELLIACKKVDHTFYPVIYGADESDDWTDPAVWKKANPSLGITVGIDKVKDACESAKQNPGEENSFRQLRLNQWVKQAVRWMPMEKWDKCEFAVCEDDLEGRVCYGGLDLSSTTDITAFVLVFPPLDDEDKYIILPYFWIPEDNLDLRVRRDHVPYDVWERQGFLQTTEGNVAYYGYIEKFIESLGERFNIREIAFDRWGAVQMVQNLEGMGFTVVPFGQGFKDMSPPTKELMKLVLEQCIAHGGHPVLRWMMDNIFIRTDPAGNIKPDKEKSTEKIDGAVATIMALDRAIRCGNDKGESVYDRRGLLFL